MPKRTQDEILEELLSKIRTLGEIRGEHVVPDLINTMQEDIIRLGKELYEARSM